MKKSSRRLRDIVFLDIGSTKVCGCIVRIVENTLEVLGVGHYAATGVRGGQVVDIEAAQHAVLRTLEAAEEAADRTARSLYFSVPGIVLRTSIAQGRASVSGEVVTESDIVRALAEIHPFEGKEDLEILHAIPLTYTLDNVKKIEDPRGMVGETLEVTVHFIAAPRTVLNNLRHLAAKSHLGVAGFVAGPYATGLALLSEEDWRLGTIVLDFGGETTSFSSFKDGTLTNLRAIPLGGNHITKDLAYGLNTSLVNAERAKTLHGSCLLSSTDERELVFIPGEEDARGIQLQQVPKALLARIIQPRVEEILERSREKIVTFPANSGQRLFLTGGGSQLPGLRDLTSSILGKQVRSEVFQDIRASQPLSPGFSAVLGAARYFVEKRHDFLATGLNAPPQDGFKGIWNWIKKNL